jgi:thiamine-phosphate pyrophosphorylase
MLPPPVHLVTDRRLVSDLAGAVRLAVRQAAPGQVAVHLREKDLGGAALLRMARALAAICHQAGQLLLVNDRIDVALAAGADGVHLPSRGVPPADARRLLGPGRWVGISCHAIEDVRAALTGGADYATFGPVFDTPSKRRYGAPVGLDALRGAAALGLPLVALGGVDVARAAQVVEAGASGVAAIRAWLEAPDPGRPVAAFIEAATRP